jgi:hypothetical protein
MRCRRLRLRSWWSITLPLIVCLALVGGIAVIPATWPDEGFPSLTPTTHDLPLSALAEASAVRIEKQAQSHRLSIKKPERGVRPSTTERMANSRPSPPTPRAFRSLPRRHLYAPRSRPSSPDDPSNRLLS